MFRVLQEVPQQAWACSMQGCGSGLPPLAARRGRAVTLPAQALGYPLVPSVAQCAGRSKMSKRKAEALDSSSSGSASPEEDSSSEDDAPLSQRPVQADAGSSDSEEEWSGGVEASVGKIGGFSGWLQLSAGPKTLRVRAQQRGGPPGRLAPPPPPAAAYRRRRVSNAGCHPPHPLQATDNEQDEKEVVPLPYQPGEQPAADKNELKVRGRCRPRMRRSGGARMCMCPAAAAGWTLLPAPTWVLPPAPAACRPSSCRT